MVASGATLTFDVQGQTGGWFPIDDTDLRARVVNNLTPFFDVLAVSITRGSTLANVIDLEWFHWKFAAVVTVRTRSAYAESRDVGSIVASVFYGAAGAAATVTNRTAGEQQAPGVITTGGELSHLVEGIADQLGVTVFVLVVGIVGIVALLAYGPNVKSVAKAVTL